MNKIWMKVGLPLVALGIGVTGMLAIKASADEEDEKKAVDTRPTVKVESVLAQDYPVVITTHGEVTPFETTMLAAQVSGEVVSWHPDFVPGGLIRRGEILFSVEKDSYQAALLQAQAELNQAQAQLIEEQARADVAKQEAKNLPNNKVTDLYLRKPQVLSAKASLKSAEARMKIAKRDLDNTDVRAPYDALVIARNVGIGQYVNQGAAIAELNNIEIAEVIVPIAGFDQTFLPANMAGKQANVYSKGFDAVKRKGVIDRDLGVVDKATRMSQLVLRIEDPYGLETSQTPIKFGTYVEVNFTGKTLSNIYRLPQELVTERTVWVVDTEQKLTPKQVEVVREEGTYLLVSQGLSDEDKVVVTLPEYPQKGMEVKLADAAVGGSEQESLVVQSLQ